MKNEPTLTQIDADLATAFLGNAVLRQAIQPDQAPIILDASDIDPPMELLHADLSRTQLSDESMIIVDPLAAARQTGKNSNALLNQAVQDTLKIQNGALSGAPGKSQPLGAFDAQKLEELLDRSSESQLKGLYTKIKQLQKQFPTVAGKIVPIKRRTSKTRKKKK